MAIPPTTPAARAPAPATPILVAPLAAPVAEATALEALEAAPPALLAAPDTAEETPDRTLEADWEAEEATPPDELELAAEEVMDMDAADPELAVWDGRSLSVSFGLCHEPKRNVRSGGGRVTSGGDGSSSDG